MGFFAGSMRFARMGSNNGAGSTDGADCMGRVDCAAGGMDLAGRVHRAVSLYRAMRRERNGGHSGRALI